MRVNALFNRLLPGKGFRVRSVCFEQGEIHIGIVSGRSAAGATMWRLRPNRPSCLIARNVPGDILASLAARTLLEPDLRRVRCRRCGVRTEQVAWARTGSRLEPLRAI